LPTSPAIAQAPATKPPNQPPRGRPRKHEGDALDRHRAAQREYHTRIIARLSATELEDRREGKRIYMRTYRERRPDYVAIENRRRRSSGTGAKVLVPALAGLHHSASELRMIVLLRRQTLRPRGRRRGQGSRLGRLPKKARREVQPDRCSGCGGTDLKEEYATDSRYCGDCGLTFAP
jgi:hypothetical protein